MIDTIAALIAPAHPLPESLFSGGSIITDFGDSDVQARLWLNPADGEAYHPRVTYWRDLGSRTGTGLTDFVSTPHLNADGEVMTDHGLLKIEFSVPKYLGLEYDANPTEEEVATALQKATDFVHHTFGDYLPHVSSWICQRVDYTHNWHVDTYLAAYMSVLDKLRFKNYSRHPFEAMGGVVWKSKSTKGRWVKFYNKTREQGIKSTDEVLRFEVSNFSNTVKYIAKAWFGNERYVGEMVKFPRALYVMCRVWDELGLGKGDEYGHREMLDVRLRNAFSLRDMPRASYALQMIERYGVRAYSEDAKYMSKTSYYRWRKLLSQAGLLTSINDNDSVVLKALEALHLPVQPVFDIMNKLRMRHNLGTFPTPRAEHIKKISGDFDGQTVWREWAMWMDLPPSVKRSTYLHIELDKIAAMRKGTTPDEREKAS